MVINYNYYLLTNHLSNNSLDEDVSPPTDLYWSSLLNVYGKVQPGISQIWLENPYMDTPIVGTIVPNPLDDRFLIYNVDPQTLPQNTLSPVNAVINPQMQGPNAGLPGPINGVRYLIVENIGSVDATTVAWGGLVANANDIVQFDSTTMQWFVAYDSQADTEVQYVTNLATTLQYRYTPDEGWMKSYEGFYYAGDYSIVI